MSSQKTLGLIGGLGVGATILYYDWTVAACKARGFVPKLVMSHANAPTALACVTEGRLTDLADYLAGFARQLQLAGADVLAIPAITPHVCLADLQARIDLPFIDILQVTADTIKARGAKRVALFGTRFSMESRLFGRLDEFDIVTPEASVVDEIHRIYVEIATTGKGTSAQEARLRELAHILCRRDGAEAIVLAGTDLNLVFNEANTDFPAIDCARAHVEAIADYVRP